GTYHGLRRKHIDTYLNEFVFRYNRRFYRHVSFETMLGLASHHHPTSYWDIVGRENPRKGVPTVRRGPRRRRTATGMRADGSRPPEKLEPSPVSDLTRQPYILINLGQRDEPLLSSFSLTPTTTR